jgi:hypothetical protein
MAVIQDRVLEYRFRLQLYYYHIRINTLTAAGPCTMVLWGAGQIRRARVTPKCLETIRPRPRNRLRLQTGS